MSAVKRRVVLLSGGLDSVVALAIAHAEGDVALALTIDYGQRAREAEKLAAQAIAAHFNVRWEWVALPWFHQLLPPQMARQVYGESAAGPVTPRDPAIPDSTRAVWAPNRNGVLLNIAAAYAEALEADAVVFGANADEAQGFPDNTQAYRDALSAAFAFSTLRHIQVETPVGDMTKAEIIERGLSLGVPFRHIWSCYGGGPQHCGQCASCGLLREAVERANQRTGQRAEIRFAASP
ncbi:MAG: 7-cyano-7-deazaguanine synthase QueC [Vampirovibrionales bacterium]|nr:7-cyano-7-deazaguanine synthase QueC [Vampirovibrionales bacterium]